MKKWAAVPLEPAVKLAGERAAGEEMPLWAYSPKLSSVIVLFVVLDRADPDDRTDKNSHRRQGSDNFFS